MTRKKTISSKIKEEKNTQIFISPNRYDVLMSDDNNSDINNNVKVIKKDNTGLNKKKTKKKKCPR